MKKKNGLGIRRLKARCGFASSFQNCEDLERGIAPKAKGRDPMRSAFQFGYEHLLHASTVALKGSFARFFFFWGVGGRDYSYELICPHN